MFDIAELLRAAGAAEPLSAEDQFVAACARGDAAELPGSLPAERLRLFADAAAWGSAEAVKTMVECHWPISARGRDWDATALNHAVMRVILT